MKVLLDTCVLYPTVLRQILLGSAKLGLYTPLWSAEILSEWAHVAAKREPQDAILAHGEIALAKSQFPKAQVSLPEGLARRLWLPDASDIHVLSAAIAGSADQIVTWNIKDFPKHILAEEGLTRQDPDRFLYTLLQSAPMPLRGLISQITETFCKTSNQTLSAPALLKKAQLPRLAKAIDT